MKNGRICLLAVLLLFSLVAYGVSSQSVQTSSNTFYSNDSVSLGLPNGYNTYIFGCAVGSFTISNISFTPTVKAPTNVCIFSGNVCAYIGYQQSNMAYCKTNNIDEGVLAGIATNGSMPTAAVFSTSGTNATTLNYNINRSNSTAIIVGASGYWESTTSLPAGCTPQLLNNYSSSSGYASVSIALCHQPIGSYSVTLSPLSPANTPTSVAIAAYVFSSYSAPSSTTTISQTGGGGGSGGGGGAPSGGGNSGGGGGGGSSKPIINETGDGYIISNIAQLNSFNVTINGQTFNVTLNFINPTGAGFTVKGTKYSLNAGTSQQLTGDMFVSLVNVSYLPILQTVTLKIYTNQTLDLGFSSSNPVDFQTIPSAFSRLVSITNASANYRAPGGYNKIAIMNISLAKNVFLSRISANVSYLCSIGSQNLTALIFKNNTWINTNFTVDSGKCRITVAIPEDPVLGIFEKSAQTTNSTTTIITTAPTTTVHATTVPANPSNVSSNGNMLNYAIIAVVAIAIIIAAYFAINKRRKR